MRRVAVSIAAAAALTGAPAGCGDGGGDSGAGAPSPSAQPDRIVVATGSAPRTLDPAKATRRSETLIAAATQLPLLTFRHRVGDDAADLEPALARDLPRLSDDRREYRFRLRPGLVYSDGRLVKASDVERAIAHASRNATNPRIRAVLDGIAGAPSADGETLRGVRSDDINGTVVVSLRAPDGQLPQVLADPATAPIPELPADDPRVLPPATGPLRVARTAGASVELVANPLRAKIDTVPAARTSQVAVLGRPATEADIADGSVGVTFDLGPTRTGATQQTVSAASGAQWSLLVSSGGAFSTRADREALAEAVDRRLITQIGNAGRPSCGLYPSWIVGASTRDDCPPVPVQDGDQPLLGSTVRVGVPPGVTTPNRTDTGSLTDALPTTPPGATLSGPSAITRAGTTAEAVVLAALDELGATTATERTSSTDTAAGLADLTRALTAGEIDAALVRTTPELPHPAGYLAPVASVDVLIAQQIPSQTSKPLTGSGGAWSRLERRAIDRAIAIPISGETTTVAVSDRVDPRSVVLHPVLGLDLAALRLQ